MALELKRYFEKSEKSLKVAKELFELGHFEDACSKAYYVMFYAVNSIRPSRIITQCVTNYRGLTTACFLS